MIHRYLPIELDNRRQGAVLPQNLDHWRPCTKKEKKRSRSSGRRIG